MSVLEACDLLGINIPRFCYHERLKIAGNCRMCLVEVENTPKPIASCAFPVSNDMKIFTNTPLVQKARENVLEFLLINHPLDCPICDQAGECDLQEQVLSFGSDRSRFFFEKRVVLDKQCGPLIKTIMTRCIHCTRCIRFFQDVVGESSLGVTLRGRESEIGTYVDTFLDSELSGNIIDLCPVGALTSKPYAFSVRPWELKKKKTIDVSDGIGCNIIVNYKENEVLRITPSNNENLNEEWISDKTRFFFDGLKRRRLETPFKKVSEDYSKINWQQALKIFDFKLQESLRNNKNILIICGKHMDLESSIILKSFINNFNIPIILEEGFHLDSNLIINTKLSVTFQQILKSDFCLLLGTNPKMEASLLNVRLRTRYLRGNFSIARFGLQEKLPYKSSGLGITTKTFLAFIEGKHSFCEYFLNSFKPVIIIGEGILNRQDGIYIISLIKSLLNQNLQITEDWVGLGILTTSSNFVGRSSLGILTNNSFNNLSVIDFFFCMGLDSCNFYLKQVPLKTFSIISTAYGDSSLTKANLILPSSSFIEKSFINVNMEGRVQKGSKIFAPFALSRPDKDILKAFLFINKKSIFSSFLGSYSFYSSFLNINFNSNVFTKKILLIENKKYLKIFKTSFKGVIFDFFKTNSITKNSKILSKCSFIAHKQFKNFK